MKKLERCTIFSYCWLFLTSTKLFLKILLVYYYLIWCDVSAYCVLPNWRKVWVSEEGFSLQIPLLQKMTTKL